MSWDVGDPWWRCPANVAALALTSLAFASVLWLMR